MMPRKKMFTVFSAAVLAIGLTACGGSSTTTDPAPEPPPPPQPPTDQETTASGADAAATAAKGASDAAKMSGDGAGAAVAGLATMQTNAMAAMYADGAGAFAATAMAEYTKAKAASEAAAAATLASVAGVEKAKAEAAQMAAEAAAEMAADNAMKAMEAAMMELMVDGTMKSVGDTTVDADAPRTEVTSGSGDSEQTTLTGLIDTPMTTGPMTDGQAAVDENPVTGMIEYKSPMVNAEARSDLEIGKVVDSADDMARLQIITAYAGTRMVRVYATDGGADWQSNKAGTVVINSDGTPDDNGVPDGADATVDVVATLRPVGMFYRADNDLTDTSDGTANTITANDPTDATPPVQQGDTVASKTKAMQVYSFVNTAAEDEVVYVVLDETRATTDEADDTITEYDYSVVTVHVEVNQDGLGETDGAGDENVFVTAALPAAMSYDHVHFGVWAGLGEAAKDGSQDIASLGIGFVQSIGDGMTGADMPNSGDASYTGNWAGTVQQSHPDGDGAITQTHGAAEVSADFAKGDITATLTDLATLKGDITGSTFSGDAVSGLKGMHGLDTEATFTGGFSGGFYGEKAAETAGIFDFSSADNKGGAFRGAFGGAKDE